MCVKSYILGSESLLKLGRGAVFVQVTLAGRPGKGGLAIVVRASRFAPLAASGRYEAGLGSV